MPEQFFLFDISSEDAVSAASETPKTSPNPSASPLPEPAAKPVTEPATEPTAEPATEPVTEPVTEPATDSTAKPVSEPTNESRAKINTESGSNFQSVSDLIPDSVWGAGAAAETFLAELSGKSEEAQIPLLRERLSYWNRRYYQDSVSEIADTDYDFLMKRLEALESRHPELASASSPTQRVGGGVIDSLKEVYHKVEMLSIENVYEPAGVMKFVDAAYRKLPSGTEIQWVLELKIDGVAMALHYEKGVLVQAVTRGDGVKGNDVTHNVRTIRDVPLELTFTDPRYPIPEELEIRGEVYLTNGGLSLLNERQKEAGKELYANPRNAASGSILLKDPKICSQRPLRMFCHSVGVTETLPCKNHTEFLEAVRSWGLVPTPNVQHFTRAEDAVTYCEMELESLFSYDFEADGFVLKVDDFAQRKELGETSKFPRWMVALKFQKYEAVTKLLRIRTQVGKTGVITPVAELEPVQLAGTVVSRSSLHNADEIRRKDVRVGDYVVVEKAGKIIPHIVRSEIHRRETELPEYQFPTECPVCGSKLVQDAGGVFIRCSNAHCPARWGEKILFFGSRDAMNVKGLGTRLGAQLMEQGLVKTYADLYRLEDVLTPPQIRLLDRVGEKMVRNLCDAIRESKKRGLARLLTALSIPHLGKETAELLAMRFLTMDALQQAPQAEIALVDGIGETIAESTWQFLHSEEGLQIIEDLRSVGVLMEFVDENGRLAAAASENAFLPLAGQTIVATGKLVRFTRPEIEALITKLGGKPASSVSAKTSFVVAGEDAGSKRTKALELGIPIYSEDEFLEKFQLSPEAESEP